jgi:hypothetical protein
MINRNHFEATAVPEVRSFDLNEWVDDAAKAIAKSIDEEILKCLSTIHGTTYSSPPTTPLTDSKLRETRELMRNSQALLTLSRPTFERTESGIRSELLCGVKVLESDRAIAASSLVAA